MASEQIVSPRWAEVAAARKEEGGSSRDAGVEFFQAYFEPDRPSFGRRHLPPARRHTLLPSLETETVGFWSKMQRGEIIGGVGGGGWRLAAGAPLTHQSALSLGQPWPPRPQ